MARHFRFDDGGRAAAGYKGKSGDCVVRAIAIATGHPYQEIHDLVNHAATYERTGKRKRGKSNARTGVYRSSISRVMKSLGWMWTPTMQIGSGCTVHLRAGELPPGRLVVSVSKHLTAVIDGVIHDTHDCSRRGRDVCMDTGSRRALNNRVRPQQIYVQETSARPRHEQRHSSSGCLVKHMNTWLQSFFEARPLPLHKKQRPPRN